MNVARRTVAGVCVVLSVVGPVRAGGLEARSARALDAGERTSVMVLVRNTSADHVTIQDLQIGGVPIADLMQPADPKKPGSPGKGVDWYDVRPRTIPAGGAALIVLGSAARHLREPRLVLSAVTDHGAYDLSVPAPKPESLRIACAAFDAERRHLTLFVRNDGTGPAEIRDIEFNGRRIAARVTGSPIPPKMMAVATVDCGEAVPLAADCALLVSGNGATATAWFRAFPAESLNYPFYGQFCDGRDLAEKHMDVYVTRGENNVNGFGELIDKNGGVMPESLAKQVAGRAATFGKSPGAWAWYLEDDAAWGRPRPQTLIQLGDFLRGHGSLQQQFLCNPADVVRYAWTSDFYMNYFYHVTHQSSDPTTFGGERSLEGMLRLNEPAPVLYLVDTVGQSVRWITVAEEELASYAMLGRGAKYLGWFLIASVWEQGGELHGGIDSLETKPWRYQQGATACPQVWTQVGNIAGVFKALQPYLAASARLPGELRPDRVEVLPLLCRDDLIVTVLLNRRQRCGYPTDFPGKDSYGGIKLQPQRDLTISQALPSWITPARVLLFDHDRGLRETRFEVSKGRLVVAVDALDTSALLLVCPTTELADKLQHDWPTFVHPSAGGSPIRADVVQAPAAPRQAWDAPACGYRTTLTITGPVAAGAWIKAALPVEPGPYGPLGYFDPHSVVAPVNGQALPVRVDYFRPVSAAAQGAASWTLAKGDTKATIEQTEDGVKIVSTWGHDKPGAYGVLSFKGTFDPRYDIIEMRRAVEWGLHPTLSYQRGVSGQKSGTGDVDLNECLFDNWPYSQLLTTPGQSLPLSRIYWQRWVAHHEGRTNWTPSEASLRVQIYEATYRFGEIRQCRSAPEVFVSLPVAVPAGERRAIEVYWNYGMYPCADTPALTVAERPATASTATAGPREGFQLAAVDFRLAGGRLEKLALTAQARAAVAWVEARDAAGTLLAARNLRPAGARQWSLAEPPLTLPDGVQAVTAYVADDTGHVVAVPLQEVPRPVALRQLAQVPGQVETLSCSADGRWILVGADKVDALDEQGNVKWSIDLGTHRRQQGRYGPGRNIEQVAVRPDGQYGFARTFRYNEKTRSYEDSFLVSLTAGGKQSKQVDCVWQSPAHFAADGQIECIMLNGKEVSVRINPVDGVVTNVPRTHEEVAAITGECRLVMRHTPGKPAKPVVVRGGKELYEITWPPYTLHQLLLRDGRVVATTTQGRIQLLGVDGRVGWELRRPGRIDAAMVLEDKGLLAIAYKQYPHHWDWQATPRLELIELATGRTSAVWEGVAADDFGHFGTNLQLAAARHGERLYLGAPDGRVYACDVTEQPKTVR